jgi:hypothetical protein
MMRNQLEERLRALKAEFESGQRMLADLESREASLRETLLRISGAIQVLEELLATDASGMVQPTESVEREGEA